MTIEKSNSIEPSVNFVSGYELNYGFLSPSFITDSQSHKTELANPLILLYDSKIKSDQQILKYLEHASKLSRPLLIVCNDMEADVLGTLVLNKHSNSLKICVVSAPAFENESMNKLEDIAVLTGGRAIDRFAAEQDQVHNELAIEDVLGECEKVIVSKETTLIVKGKGDKRKIRDRHEYVK